MSIHDKARRVRRAKTAKCAVLCPECGQSMDGHSQAGCLATRLRGAENEIAKQKTLLEAEKCEHRLTKRQLENARVARVGKEKIDSFQRIVQKVLGYWAEKLGYRNGEELCYLPLKDSRAQEAPVLLKLGGLESEKEILETALALAAEDIAKYWGGVFPCKVYDRCYSGDMKDSYECSMDLNSYEDRVKCWVAQIRASAVKSLCDKRRAQALREAAIAKKVEEKHGVQ